MFSKRNNIAVGAVNACDELGVFAALANRISEVEQCPVQRGRTFLRSRRDVALLADGLQHVTQAPGRAQPVAVLSEYLRRQRLDTILQAFDQIGLSLNDRLDQSDHDRRARTASVDGLAGAIRKNRECFGFAITDGD